MRKIAIIGAGNMGSAIAAGLCGRGYTVAVSNRSEGKLLRLKEKCPGIEAVTTNADAAADADVVIVAVEPAVVDSVLLDLAGSVSLDGRVIVFLAASHTVGDVESLLDGAGVKDARVLKVIPNIAAKVGESMTLISHNCDADGDVDETVRLFECIGSVAVVPESQMGALTAICSCGLAYAMRYVQAAMAAGVELGIAPGDAKRYELQTMLGAVKLLLESGEHPAAMIDEVTTPGGITIKGLNEMEKYGFSNSVIEGLLVASKRKSR